MKNFWKLLMVVVASSVTLFAFGGTPVHAVVIEWSVEATAAWDDTQTLPAGTFIDGDTLSWGTGSSGPSTLQINPEVAGQPTTGNLTTVGVGGTALGDPGTILNTFDITHTNNPITGASLESTVLTLGLTLTPFNPSGFSLGPFNLNVPIVFEETPNAGPCAGGTSTPCADIFVIGATAFDFPFVYDFETYFLSGFPLSGGTFSSLLDEQCTAAGAAPGCIGFVTEESTATTAEFGVAIATRPQFPAIPEPSTWLLLGSGLIGLIAYKRRRR